MKRKYSNIYNQNTIYHVSSFKFKSIFSQEDHILVQQYNIYVINEYIKTNYQYTIRFLNNLKKILKKTQVKLLDLDEQEMQLLEERVFSIQRHIKVLPTNFPLEKGEKVGIKFIHAKIYHQLRQRFNLIHEGELLISNRRIIFIASSQNLIFYWHDIKYIDYRAEGFVLIHDAKEFVISIHDNEALNNTLRNFMSKINNHL